MAREQDGKVAVIWALKMESASRIVFVEFDVTVASIIIIINFMTYIIILHFYFIVFFVIIIMLLFG